MFNEDNLSELSNEKNLILSKPEVAGMKLYQIDKDSILKIKEDREQTYTEVSDFDRALNRTEQKNMEEDVTSPESKSIPDDAKEKRNQVRV